MATTMGSAEAIRRLAVTRDSDAWAAVLELHGAEMLQTARRITRDAALADDVCQDALLQIRDNAQRFTPPASDQDRAARGWIMRITCNAALKLIRGRKRSTQRENERLQEAPAVSQAPAVDLQLALRQELASLPEHERLPVMLHYYAGLDHDGVAAALECPVGTVKAQLHRGVERLRQRLAMIGLVFSIGGLSELLSEPAMSAESAPKPSSEQLAQWHTLLHAAAPPVSAVSSKGISFMTKVCLGTMVLALALSLMLAGRSNGGDAAKGTTVQEGAANALKMKTQGLIKQLDDNDYAVRNRAEQALLAMGDGVRPHVRAALGTDDPDVRLTLTRILSELRSREVAKSVLWKVKEPGGATGVQIDSGMVAFTSAATGETIGIDAYSGQERWRVQSKMTMSGLNKNIAARQGHCFVSGYLRTLSLEALNIKTGALAWTSSAPVLSHNIYSWRETGSADILSASETGVSAFDPRTGAERKILPRDSDTGSYDPVANDTHCVYLKSERTGLSLRGVEIASNRELWSRPLDRNCDSMILHENIVYCVAGQQGINRPSTNNQRIIALDVATGNEKWAQEIDGSFKTIGAKDIQIQFGKECISPLLIDNYNLVFAGNSHVYALDRNTGTERWRFKIPVTPEDAVWLSVPMRLIFRDTPPELKLRPQVVGLALGRDEIVFASVNGVYGLDSTTGNPVWFYHVPRPIAGMQIKDGVLAIASMQPFEPPAMLMGGPPGAGVTVKGTAEPKKYVPVEGLIAIKLYEPNVKP